MHMHRYARLLKVRKEVHARLRLVDFVRMAKAVKEFVQDVTHLCPKARVHMPHATCRTWLKRGRPPAISNHPAPLSPPPPTAPAPPVRSQAYSALTAELQQHAASFLRTLHEDNTRKLSAIVELEQWKQVEVAPEFQQIADAFGRKQVPVLASARPPLCPSYTVPVLPSARPTLCPSSPLPILLLATLMVGWSPSAGAYVRRVRAAPLA